MRINVNKIKYISKGEWFDKGTECKLIDDYKNGMGLFEGIRTIQNPKAEGGGKIGDKRIDSEICDFDEFDIVKGE